MKPRRVRPEFGIGPGYCCDKTLKDLASLNGTLEYVQDVQASEA